MSDQPTPRIPLARAAAAAGFEATPDPLAPTVGYPDTEFDAAPPVAPAGYELLEEIGSGGMGFVYRAREIALNRHVALKILHTRYASNGVAARRFNDEARITGQLQHPGIPPIHQIGTLPDGRPFLAMKLINGNTLENLLKERAGTSENRGRFLANFEQVCQAVGYAHAHNVIHRDLKPANVMVGSFAEVQVMDWGVAKTLTADRSAAAVQAEADDSLADEILSHRHLDSATQAGSILGTFAYMPPEQAGGEIARIDTRSDVFGLGAILCVILTGRAPYADKDIDTVRLMSIGGQLVEGLARLDACGAEPELITLCKRCLSLDPKNRPADGGEVAAAVAAFRTASEERARRAEIERAQAEIATAEQRKRRKVQTALGLTFTLLVLLGSAFAWRTQQERLAKEAEERERRAAVERGVNQSVEAAVARYAQARGADNDLALWAEARAAALLAQARAASADAAAEVQDRIKSLVGEIEQTEKNRRLVVTLLEVQASMGDQLLADGAQDFPGADARYEQAFRDYGTDLFALSPEQGAALLRTLGGSRVMELAAALDDWAYVRGFGPDGENSLARLLRVTRRLDPDPMRNRIRDAITARDREALKKIGDDLDPASQPVQTVNLIAVFINLYGGSRVYHPDTVDYLMRAQPHHSGDFQINHNIAWTCNQLGRNDEAFLYSLAAIAVRPKSAAAWADRAVALRGLGRHAEAAEAYRRVLSLSPGSATAGTGLGRALYQCGDQPGAVAAWRQVIPVWRQAIEEQPGRASYRRGLHMTHVFLGNALRTQGDWNGAIAEFVNAITLYPMEPTTYALLAEAVKARSKPTLGQQDPPPR